MSTTEFDWTAVYNRLLGVRDDDIRSAALLIAEQLWSRRAARGKRCSLPTLCWRAVQLARRRASRDSRVDVCSAAVECAAERVQDRPARVACDWEALTPRQRTIVDGLQNGASQRDIAAALGVHAAQVGREIERMSVMFAAD